MEENKSLQHFREGEEVEVGDQGKGLKGSWFAATVLPTPPDDTTSISARSKSLKKKMKKMKKKKKELFVEYHTLLEDNSTTSPPLREYVRLSQVRPKPPQQEEEEMSRPFEIFEKVDAYFNDGWWEGNIAAVLENQRYRVYFEGDFDEKEMEFQRSDLRGHLDWIDAKWVPWRRQEISVSPGQTKSQLEEQKKSPTLAELFGKRPLVRCSKNHPKRKSQAQEQQMQLIPLIEEGAHLGGTLIGKQVDGLKKQHLNVFKRRKSSEQKLPCAGDLVKAGLQKTAGSTSPLPTTECGARDSHLAPGSSLFVRFEEAITETGISHGTQPVVELVKEATSKDTPIRGIELRKSFDMVNNLPSSSGTSNLDQMDQATVEEHNECVMEAFLIDSELDDNLPIVGEDLPFAKRSSFWNIVDEMDAFHLIPQHMDFGYLEKFETYRREGIAIGSMVTFENLMLDIANLQFSDNLIDVLQKRYKTLDDLEAIGFNVQPLRARLDKFQNIKAKHGQLNHDLVAAEKQLHQKQIKRGKLLSMLDSINEQKRVLEDQINQLNKEQEAAMNEEQIEGSKISMLQDAVDTIREHIVNAKLEFDREATAPWHWIVNRAGFFGYSLRTLYLRAGCGSVHVLISHMVE